MGKDWVQRIGRFKKIFTGIVIFFAVFTLFGFFGLPPIVKSLLTKKLSEALHREVTIRADQNQPLCPFFNRKGVSRKGQRGFRKIRLL